MVPLGDVAKQTVKKNYTIRRIYEKIFNSSLFYNFINCS
nr:MAG TPA: Protein of unknown function (DUF1585) [Caudoviricetes sp.]